MVQFIIVECKGSNLVWNCKTFAFAKKRNIDTMAKPFVKWVGGKGQFIEFASGELEKESVTEKISDTASSFPSFRPIPKANEKNAATGH